MSQRNPVNIENDSSNYSEEQLLTAAFNSSESVRFIVERDGTILHFNRKAYENGQLLHNKILKRGDNLFDYASDPSNDVANGLRVCIERAFAGETFYSEAEIKFEGGARWFKSEYVPIFDKLKIIAVSIHIHEITDEKLAQLLKDQTLADIKTINYSRLNESKTSLEQIIKDGKESLKALTNNPNDALKKNLLNLVSVASELKTKVTRWKKL